MIFQSEFRKDKAMVVAGMSSLALGLMIRTLVHPATAPGANWLDGIFGMFIGMSIALNLGSVILQNRLRRSSKP